MTLKYIELNNVLFEVFSKTLLIPETKVSYDIINIIIMYYYGLLHYNNSKAIIKEISTYKKNREIYFIQHSLYFQSSWSGNEWFEGNFILVKGRNNVIPAYELSEFADKTKSHWSQIRGNCSMVNAVGRFTNSNKLSEIRNSDTVEILFHSTIFESCVDLVSDLNFDVVLDKINSDIIIEDIIDDFGNKFEIYYYDNSSKTLKEGAHLI